MLNPYEPSQVEPIAAAAPATAVQSRTLVGFLIAIATVVPVYLLFRLFAEYYVSIYRSSVSTLHFWTSMLTWPTFGVFLATVTHVTRLKCKLTFNDQLGVTILFGWFTWATKYVDSVKGFQVMARDGLEFASVSGGNYAHAISMASFWLGFPLLVGLSMLWFATKRSCGLLSGELTGSEQSM